LFINQGFTTRIKQLSRAESDAMLRFLLAHIAQGHAFQVRYRWKMNAVAVWDNRITSHIGTFDYLPGNRQAVRVTPHGEIPFFDPNA
jgi:sulfonate dioxygenase